VSSLLLLLAASKADDTLQAVAAVQNSFSDELSAPAAWQPLRTSDSTVVPDGAVVAYFHVTRHLG
jgi:hypothetical protein